MPPRPSVRQAEVVLGQGVLVREAVRVNTVSDSWNARTASSSSRRPLVGPRSRQRAAGDADAVLHQGEVVRRLVGVELALGLLVVGQGRLQALRRCRLAAWAWPRLSRVATRPRRPSAVPVSNRSAASSKASTAPSSWPSSAADQPQVVEGGGPLVVAVAALEQVGRLLRTARPPCAGRPGPGGTAPAALSTRACSHGVEAGVEDGGGHVEAGQRLAQRLGPVAHGALGVGQAQPVGDGGVLVGPGGPGRGPQLRLQAVDGLVRGRSGRPVAALRRRSSARLERSPARCSSSDVPQDLVDGDLDGRRHRLGHASADGVQVLGLAAHHQHVGGSTPRALASMNTRSGVARCMSARRSLALAPRQRVHVDHVGLDQHHVARRRPRRRQSATIRASHPSCSSCTRAIPPMPVSTTSTPSGSSIASSRWATSTP